MDITEWRSRKKELLKDIKELDDYESSLSSVKEIEPLRSYFGGKKAGLALQSNELLKESVKTLKRKYISPLEESEQYDFIKSTLQRDGYSTKCSHCSTDFSLLLLNPDSLKEIGCTCSECKNFVCYKCQHHSVECVDSTKRRKVVVVSDTEDDDELEDEKRIIRRLTLSSSPSRINDDSLFDNDDKESSILSQIYDDRHLMSHAQMNTQSWSSLSEDEEEEEEREVAKLVYFNDSVLCK